MGRLAAALGRLRRTTVETNGGGHQHDLRTGLNREKLELIDCVLSLSKPRSFADLGGVWGVDGGYTFYALDKFRPESAVLVDTHPTHAVKSKARNYPHLRLIHGNFGNRHVIQEVGPVDVVFFFDVLLHQVAPDWDAVLEAYSHQAKYLVIYNQQWIGSRKTVRLLDLGEDSYFRNVPHCKTEKPYDDLFSKLAQKHPAHDRPWRDVHHIWQWGITDEDLLSRLESLGFLMRYFKDCGPFGQLPNFRDHAFIFSKGNA